MSGLTIRIRRGHDGSSSLACTRADGTATWQTNQGRTAAFFPLHDLTHHAVETELGYRRGFYGLVAEGWDLGDFGSPWPRGPIAGEAGWAELVVGFLDAERSSGALMTAAELAERAATWASSVGAPTPVLGITDEQLERIRARCAELFARWEAVPAGEAMTLTFDPRL